VFEKKTDKHILGVDDYDIDLLIDRCNDAKRNLIELIFSLKIKIKLT